MKMKRYGNKAPNSMYPWNRWLKRKTITLEKGKDFQCMVHSMAQQVRNASYHMGITVKVVILSENAIQVVRL